MVTLLDHRGRPIDRNTLAEPQSSQVASLHREFANHPSRGLTPAKLARILAEAEQGDLISQADLADDIEEKDAHVFAELSKRKRAILGIDWDIVPPRNPSAAEERAADLVREIIADLANFEDVLLDMADAIHKGYACLEYEWARLGNEWLPAVIEHRPQSWFTLPQTDRNELRLRNHSADGEALQPFGWIVHVHRARSGYLGRAGLSRILAWPFLFKNYSVRDLAEFLEIYGLPLRLGTYPTGASDTEKSTLLQAVISIGHAAAGIIPEGMAIDFKEAAKGASDPFLAMMGWAEASQSKAILGGTLTSSAENTGLGSNLGDVHNEVRHDLCVSDCRQIAGTLTRDLVYPLAVLNGSGVDSLRRAPRFVFNTQEPEDLKFYSESLPGLVKIGMRIPLDEVHERLGIRKAQDGEEVLSFASPSPPAPLKQRGGHSSAALRLQGEPQDALDAYVDRLDDESESALAALIDPVRNLLDESDSLEDFQTRLLTLYPDLNTAPLTGLLQQALATAELAGRSEAGDEEAGQ